MKIRRSRLLAPLFCLSCSGKSDVTPQDSTSPEPSFPADQVLNGADFTLLGGDHQMLGTFSSGFSGTGTVAIGTTSDSTSCVDTGGADSGCDDASGSHEGVFIVDLNNPSPSQPVATAAGCFHQGGGQVKFVGDLDGDGASEIATGLLGTGGAAIYLGGSCSNNPYLSITCMPDTCPLAVLGTGALTGSGVAILLGAPSLDDGHGAAFVLAETPGVADPEEEGIRIDGLSGDAFGCAGAVADLDGDGIDDVLLGALGAEEGTTYAFLGPLGGAVSALDADAAVDGLGAVAACDHGLAVGDLNADGNVDLALGSPDGGGAEQPGLVRVFLGPLGGARSAASADFLFTGETAFSGAGADVSAIGDVDGDGTEDLLIGAPNADLPELANAGAAYLMTGPFAGSTALSDARVRFSGESADSKSGATVTRLGDVNADGHADFAIGAPQFGESHDDGAEYVFLGRP